MAAEPRLGIARRGPILVPALAFAISLLVGGDAGAGPPKPPLPPFADKAPRAPLPPAAPEAGPRNPRPDDWHLRGSGVERRQDTLDRAFERDLDRQRERERDDRTRGRVRVYRYETDPYWYDPYGYAHTACPPGRVTIVQGRGGSRIYRCHATPVVTTVVVVRDTPEAAPRKARASSSPVIAYAVASDTVVYATTWQPRDLYWERVGDRYLWLPGVATRSPEAAQAVARAEAMDGPTGNGVVITYEVEDRLVYLTDAPPMAGIHREPAGTLHAWLAGITEPDAEARRILDSALALHAGGGAAQLEEAVARQRAKP